jgi:hypothetical protein
MTIKALELRGIPHATGELSRLLRDIALAAKRVNVEVNKAGKLPGAGQPMARTLSLPYNQQAYTKEPLSLSAAKV